MSTTSAAPLVDGGRGTKAKRSVTVRILRPVVVNGQNGRVGEYHDVTPADALTLCGPPGGHAAGRIPAAVREHRPVDTPSPRRGRSRSE